MELSDTRQSSRPSRAAPLHALALVWSMLTACAPPPEAPAADAQISPRADAGDVDVAVTCGPGTAACGTPARCVDLWTDPANCGWCGTACSAGATCVRAACLCAAGLQRCDRDCVDTSSDAAHCGACGHACEGGAVCHQGACACPAEAPTTCGSACVDLARDLSNCGACGLGCRSGTCRDGVCDGSLDTLCAGTWTDLAHDPSHCGACDRPCAPTEGCYEGLCLARPLSPSADDRLGTRRPTFRWAGGDVHVDVCGDPTCARVVATARGGDAQQAVTLPGALAPGVYFWRTRSLDGAARSNVVPFRIDQRDTVGVGMLPPPIDLDADGLRDILVEDSFGAWSVYRGDGHALFVSSTAHRVIDGPLHAVTGDFRLDGVGDLALVGSNAAALFDGAADARSLSMRALVDSPQPIGDLDGDAWVDTVRLVWGVDRVMPRFQFSRAGVRDVMSVSLTPIYVVAAVPGGDVNGDGYRDVLLRAETTPTSSVALWIGFGGPRGVERLVAALMPTNLQFMVSDVTCAGDLDGDGYADALVHLRNGDCGVFRGGDAGLSVVRWIVSDTRRPLPVAPAGDVNGDGRDDLLVSLGDHRMTLVLGGDLTAPVGVTLTHPAWLRVETLGGVGDVDGDGLDDVVAGAPGVDTVFVFHGAHEAPLAHATSLRGAPASHFGAIAL